MKTKIIIAIGITIGIVTWASIGIVLAHNFTTNPYYGGVRGYSTHYEDEDWWNEMRQYMEEHWDEIDQAPEQDITDEEFEDWWNEMKEHMDEQWADDDEDWWDEMREHMEEHWEEIEDEGYHYSGFGGGCWGW